MRTRRSLNFDVTLAARSDQVMARLAPKQETEVKAPAGTANKPQLATPPALNYVSPIKRAIAWVLTGDRAASDLSICRRFDEEGALDLPKHWKTGDNWSFERAYKDPKHRHKIEILFSRVRSDMRKQGLLG
jgi:hypothetical protein